MNDATKQKPSAMDILQGKAPISEVTKSDSFRVQIKSNKGGGITLYSQDASNKMPQGFRGACNLTTQVVVRLKYLMDDKQFKDLFLKFLQDGQQVLIK